MKVKVYDYYDFDDLPEIIKKMPNANDYLSTGCELLEMLNDRIMSKRNMGDLSEILGKYFGAELNGYKRLEIIIGEFKRVDIWFEWGKIMVRVNVD
jgi:hypothetical protein